MPKEGSTKPELLQKLVLAEGADLGIALDGDGDRLIMVDSEGEVVDGDELLFIIANAEQSIKETQGRSRWHPDGATSGLKKP